MRALVLAAVAALSLAAATSGANADHPSYHAPAHNYYQNNWMNAG